MRKTIVCPMDLEGIYDTDVQIEMQDLYNFSSSEGVYDFAILDALSLEYLGKIEIH